jgi:NADPH:quinone reductase
MRAIICEGFDGLQSLNMHEVDRPVFGPSGVPGHLDRDVRIRVHAAGINFADTLIVQGKYQLKPALPFSPGMEVAGEVTEVADGVTSVRVGDRVMANILFGGYAEEVVAPANCVYNIPDSMDWTSAASFPIAYGTSHVGLVERANLRAGEFLVVHGAAGGVGLTAVEIGKRLGATVIAAAGGPEKLEIAKQHGANHLIDYKTENVRDRVKELTGGLGAHVIYDPVGGDLFKISMRCTRPGGRMLIIGFAAGQVQEIPANLLLVKNITAIGYTFEGLRLLFPDMVRRSMEELVQWYAAGELSPHVSHTFPLEDAQEALTTLIERRSTGKIVLTM